MKKIRIAFFAYPHYRFPPDGYGPMQTVVSDIVEALSRNKNYEITVFATGDSKLPAKIICVKDTPDLSDKTVPDARIYEFLALGKLISQKEQFDIISSHVGFHILPFAKLFSCPILVNLQGDYSNSHYYYFFHHYRQDANFVTISNFQRSYLPNLNYAGTVYHGIKLDDFSYNNKPDMSQLAFLGRTDPVKGLGDAIQVALESNLKLIAGAKTTNSELAKQYYIKKVEPYIDNKRIVFLGEIGNKKRNELLSNSLALLFPINWNEPFGLVMVEAMACGTPIIAYNCGSVSEIIEDGKTGFIIRPGDVKGMIHAIKKIKSMPSDEYQKMRQNCRKRVESNFTSEKMVENYIKIYHKVLKRKI